MRRLSFEAAMVAAILAAILVVALLGAIERRDDGRRRLCREHGGRPWPSGGMARECKFPPTPAGKEDQRRYWSGGAP